MTELIPPHCLDSGIQVIPYVSNSVIIENYGMYILTFPCRTIFGEAPVISTTVDGSATLMPPSTTKSRP